jgi:hypothetical protein
LQLVIIFFFYAAVFDVDRCGLDALVHKFCPFLAELELFEYDGRSVYGCGEPESEFFVFQHCGFIVYGRR